VRANTHTEVPTAFLSTLRSKSWLFAGMVDFAGFSGAAGSCREETGEGCRAFFASVVLHFCPSGGNADGSAGCSAGQFQQSGQGFFLFSDFPHGPGKSLGETTSECWKGLNESPGDCELIPGWGAGKSV
jgi:hypothetical protein